MTEAAHKVNATHLARSAYLYVRQSTLRQVLTNTESAVRQYALRQRAIAMGWDCEQVIVIDCDQGQSGSSAADREGFQRLVAEVGMGRAGIVLGLEVSRLARNNADWHRLLELCALGATLICDEDGLYDPCDFNDRLLLGLKGTMSEAELHFIRARLRGGIISKAKRGELVVALPVGLVYDPAGQVVLDPDAGVQHAINHLFSTFARTGSARAVVKSFAAERLQFPVRVRSGPAKGELAWSALQHAGVLRALHNPRYAGAFVFGRRRWRPGPGGRAVCELQPRERWTALIPDAHPGYISWDAFESNQAQLLGNAQAHGDERAAGPAREGRALAQGLAICGRCGRRMTVRYHTRAEAEVPDYQCMATCISAGVSRCLSVPGAGIDQALSQLIVDSVTPVALEVALGVQAEVEKRAEEADNIRRSHVARARQRADIARRRYLSVDPDNRLVADNLEAGWNDALRALRDAEDDFDRAAQAASCLGEEQKAKIRALAGNFSSLWNDPATPQRERKRMARLIIEDVTIDRNAEVIHLRVRFKGGQLISHEVPVPPRAWQARRTVPGTLAALDRLLETHTDSQAAAALNADAHRSGTGQAFTTAIVLHLRRANNLPSHLERLRSQGKLTIPELAQKLGVHPSTIKAWHRAGLLVSHQANDKNIRLFDPPIPGDPRLVKKMGSSLAKRAPTRPSIRGAI
jgi:DNA invertase Pin-like site-specific DNA recombinase/DNA-binding transcriptional regulator YiaG